MSCVNILGDEYPERKNSFLYRVINRLRLKIKLWELHREFKRVDGNNFMLWIGEWHKYARKCTDIRKKINDL